MVAAIRAKDKKDFNWQNIGEEITRLSVHFQGAVSARFGRQADLRAAKTDIQKCQNSRTRPPVF